MELKLINQSKMHGGWVKSYSHPSKSCQSEMRFSVFLPPQAAEKKVPVLYWLSGLTCTDENFMTKAGAQRVAAELGLILVAPDTSPRGLNLPGDSESWDFGVGAGFYVNATQAPWSGHYRMYDYIAHELPELIEAGFPADPQRQSISGHSMGGHGALVIALRNPGRYASVSAFAPIVAPMQCPWGQKAFAGYLGSDKAQWASYDASELVRKSSHRLEILIDQGADDKFLTTQLMPQILVQACAEVNYPLRYREQPGYDHSYYFIASFIEDHLRYHARHLTQ